LCAITDGAINGYQHELTPSEYIQHHLSFFQEPLGENGFWTLNVDSVLTSIVLGVLGLGFIWWVAGEPLPTCRASAKRSSNFHRIR